MELIERPNLRAVHYLNSIKYSEFEQSCIEDASKDGLKEPKKKDMKVWYEQLKFFCKSIVRNKGIIKRIYSYSLNTPAGLGGRLFSGGSIQGIWGVYRGLLMRGIGTDIDMANAHPTILRWLCRKHGIPCPNLEYYINHRDECLAGFSSRAAGKKAYLAATNNDKDGVYVFRPDHFRLYDKEMKNIQKALVAKEEYQQLFETIPDYKKSKNYNGSAMNRILCFYENEILQKAISVINRRGIEIAILMFDGLMVYGDYYSDTGLLDEITKYVEEQMPELAMKWSYKEHDTSLEVPKNFNEKNYEDTHTGVWTDAEAADKVLELYEHWVFCNENLFVFDDSTGLWDYKEATHFKILNKFSKELTVLRQGKDGVEQSPKSYGNTTTLMRQVIPQIAQKTMNNGWLAKMENSSLGYLLFNNGYMDCRRGIFNDKFNPDIMFMYKINHDFDVFSDEEMEYMEDVKRRFFVLPLGEKLADYFMLNIGRAIAGDLMKNIFFGLGTTNCGKSVITKAVAEAFGEYVGTFNAENLAYSSSSADEAAQMRWVKLLRYKRIIFSNEMKNTVDLNGNMIKKISSGGDKLIARGHCANEEEFVPHFAAFCMANDMNNIKPYDEALQSRVRVIGFTKQFVDKPTNEFELQKDPNIENEIKSELFQRVFVGLIIQKYIEFVDGGRVVKEPDEVMNAKRDWIGADEDTNIIGRFLQFCEITNDDSHYIESREIEYWLKINGNGTTIKKFTMDLKKHCAVKGYSNVLNKLKKNNGVVRTVWFGIREIQTEIADEDDITECNV